MKFISPKRFLSITWPTRPLTCRSIGVLMALLFVTGSIEASEPIFNFLIRGAVQDEAGQPIQDATIRTLGGPTDTQPAQSTQSRSSGAFALKIALSGHYGTPAAGIRIQGESRGRNYYRGYALSDADGNYTMKVFPDHFLAIAVTEKKLAAASKIGLKVAPGKKAKADFQLIEGTMIRGTITVGKDKEPHTNDNATLILNPGGGPELVRWSDCDQYGDQQTRVCFRCSH